MSAVPSWQIRPLVLVLAASFAAACATPSNVETTVYEREDGVVVVETIRLQATVVAIDATTREITLKPRRGDVRVIKADDAVVNFGQIRVGDTVYATVIEQLAVSLTPGGAPPGVKAGAAVVLAPVGAKPGVVTVETIAVTGTIVAIDGHEHTVTLEMADGTTQEINVGKHRDLSKVALGDSVRMAFTQSVAIQVRTTKP